MGSQGWARALLVTYGLSLHVLSRHSCPLLSFRPSSWLSSAAFKEGFQFIQHQSFSMFSNHEKSRDGFPCATANTRPCTRVSRSARIWKKTMTESRTITQNRLKQSATAEIMDNPTWDASVGSF